MQNSGFRSVMILGQVAGAHLVLLFTLPLWAESAVDIGKEVGIAFLGGVLFAPACALIMASGYLNGHWFVRISWAAFVAALGVTALLLGVKFQEGTVDPDLAVALSVIPICIVMLILLEGPVRHWQRRRLAMEEAGRNEWQLSLRQLFIGTALISISFAVPSVLIDRGDLQGIQLEELLVMVLMLLVCLINSVICMFWAFASSELVILFVLLGPMYAVAVATGETLILALFAQSAGVLRVGVLAAVMIYSQCTLIMASLLYLRSRGFRLLRV